MSKLGLDEIERVLISVSDKTGIVDFAKFLRTRRTRARGRGVEILSTGGTANVLREAGLAVSEVSDYTGVPEILDGRVKTLHPKIHGGLLAIRGKASHEAQIAEHGIWPIDMVVVNLYPFWQKVAAGAHFADCIENIDIGGPAMIRSAAKNYDSVAVATNPSDYPAIIEEMKKQYGCLTLATRYRLAQKAFALTMSYDAAIAAYLASHDDEGGECESRPSLPAFPVIALEKVNDLRYGENPHQRSALYRRIGVPLTGVPSAEVLHGKEMSHNNFVDAQAAWELVREFSTDKATCVIIKHTNPCGVAVDQNLALSFVNARECDPVSAFGSVIAFNREVDPETAAEINSTFIEVVIAPGYTPATIELLKEKKNLRVLRVTRPETGLLEMRQVGNGFLIQDPDIDLVNSACLKVVTKRIPTADEYKAMLFGWRVVKHVKSNAIVFTDTWRLLGVGAGQMNRVDSVRFAAQRAVWPIKGAAMASDAFFPFPDGIEEAAKHGIACIIQPGGSMRDKEAIDAADKNDMAMVFTGIRHFRH